MEITLKNARKLDTDIDNYLILDKVGYRTKVRVNNDEDAIIDQIHDENETLKQYIVKRDDLLQLRFLIRRAIAETNEKSGINAALTTREYLKHAKSEISSTMNHVRDEDWPLIMDKINISRKALENPSSDKFSIPEPYITLNILDIEDLKTIKGKMKDINKQLTNIEDNIVVLNNTNKITLSEDHVSLLQEFDII